MRKVKGGSVKTVVMLPDPIRQDLNKGRVSDLMKSGEITKTFLFFNEVPKRKEGSVKT